MDGQYDADGNPVYVLRSRNILVVNAPPEMKRRDPTVEGGAA